VKRAILDHPNFAIAFDDRRLDFTGRSSITWNGFSPSSMIRLRASLTHFGQSESVVRGQPKVGLVFCQDFCKGFSDHFGVKEGLGLYLLKNWMRSNAPASRLRNRTLNQLYRLMHIFLVLLANDSLVSSAPKGVLTTNHQRHIPLNQ
jgi:hypothetical protein